MEKLSNEQWELKAQAKVYNLALSFIHSFSLKCAIQLGVADAIHRHGGPMSADQLATALPIHPTKARYVPRLMRFLVHSGLFATEKTETGECAYVLTDALKLLLSDHPLGILAAVGGIVEPVMMEPWRHLGSWFQSDSATAFADTYGVDFWDFGRANTEISQAFGEIMVRDSQLVGRAVTGTPKFRAVFEGVRTLVDAGGGTGATAKAVAAEFPEMECVVYDLPHVVAGLEGSGNVKFVGGDMFQAIPPGDAILLKWVLHDWSDEQSVKILEQCKKAMTSKEGKVIIIEMVIQNGTKKKNDDYESQLLFDMHMMAMVDGRERSEREWEKLFREAGFGGYKITHGLGLKSIIEVYPAINPRL